MPEPTIRSIFNGRPVNLKLDLDPNAGRNKTRKAVLRADVRSTREMNQANNAEASKTPQELGRKAGKIARDFAAGKIDMSV
ncbi:hypothetical protein ACFL6I_02185 [candidate division KSB1 bacterium]